MLLIRGNLAALKKKKNPFLSMHFYLQTTQNRCSARHRWWRPVVSSSVLISLIDFQYVRSHLKSRFCWFTWLWSWRLEREKGNLSPLQAQCDASDRFGSSVALRVGGNNDASGLGKMTAAFLDEVALRELRIKLISGLWSGLKKKKHTTLIGLFLPLPLTRTVIPVAIPPTLWMYFPL